MKDPLLDFYERELAFIREEGRDFALRYPNIAEGLRLSSAEHVEDPHVSRLIESFALLCARLRIKMQDEFPEICQSLLQALYPQFLAPVPPISVCQLTLSDPSLDVPSGRIVPRGERLETEALDGVKCQFRLSFETQLLPLRITGIDYIEQPFPFEISHGWQSQVEAAIRIKLVSQSEKLPLGNMQFDALRFYLNGSSALVGELFEAIIRDTVGVIAHSNANTSGIAIPRQCVRPVGFADNEGILDHDARTIKGFRHLWEFFAAPFKFRFVDLAIGKQWSEAIGSGTEGSILILLKQTRSVVGRELKSDTMRLGCSPLVNLFNPPAAQFRLKEDKSEVHVVADGRKPMGTEVISVDHVHITSDGGGKKRVFKPFYLPSHHADSSEEPLYWHSTRRRRMTSDPQGDRGTEVYLTFVNLKSEPQNLKDWTAHVQTTCSNREIAPKLQPGDPRHKLTLRSAGSAVKVDMLMKPTMTLRPLVPEEHYWRLLSHLALNHLTLTNTVNGADALREILTLYNPHGGDELKRVIQSIESVKYERVVGRLPTSVGTGFCRGVQIELVVDEERLIGLGRYLFATVLDHFFAQFATINSFTQLVVREKASLSPFYQGSPRAGDRELI